MVDYWGTSLSLADVDTTKDPCQKVKCSRHKVCVAQGYQRAVCVNRKKLEHRWAFQIYRTLSSCAWTIIQDSVCFLRVWIKEAWCHAEVLCRMQLSSLAFHYSERHIMKNQISEPLGYKWLAQNNQNWVLMSKYGCSESSLKGTAAKKEKRVENDNFKCQKIKLFCFFTKFPQVFT